MISSSLKEGKILQVLPDKEHKAQYVQKMFNEIAGRYDLMNTLMTLGMDRSWRKFVVRCARVSAGDTVLDICCGTGMLSLELAKKVGKGGVVGLDFSKEMLAVAASNLARRAAGDNIQLIRGDAMAIPFPDNCFDAVTVAWGLRNVPDLEIVLAEMRRVVKPGGKVVSLDMAKPGAPVFKQLYWLYFEKIVPLLGKVWAGKKSAYSYLYRSALEFPHQKRLAELFGSAGLRETKSHDLFGGIVAVVEGTK